MRPTSGPFLAILLACAAPLAGAGPYIPANDRVVLADVPVGARHGELIARNIARQRIDVALPLAQHYIQQARGTGDLRYLGYAEAVIAPWLTERTQSADAWILHATVLQSRHQFQQALKALDTAHALRPDDAQAWLTSATVLRVMGRFSDSLGACRRINGRSYQSISELCAEASLSLTGDLQKAYDTVAALPAAQLAAPVRAWRDTELGEMAVRLGHTEEAERWFISSLTSDPADFYTRAAYADVMLQDGRAQEVLALLRNQEALEPLLLRIAIAQRLLRDPGLGRSRERLEAAFAAESQRGEEVHRREQARYLLDVQLRPQAALAVARENFKVQREADDLLILIRAAYAAGDPSAAQLATTFMRENRLQDARIAKVTASRS